MMITHDVDEAVLMSDRVVMMTNGPAATIGQIMDVPLARPRNRIALAEDKVYNHCRQEILSFLYEKQRKVEPIARAQRPAHESEVALRARTGKETRSMKKSKLVMVGNGMAGMRTIEELLKIAPELYDITVFGAEPTPTTTASCCRRCWPASRRWTRSC